MTWKLHICGIVSVRWFYFGDHKKVFCVVESYNLIANYFFRTDLTCYTRKFVTRWRAPFFRTHVLKKDVLIFFSRFTDWRASTRKLEIVFCRGHYFSTCISCSLLYNKNMLYNKSSTRKLQIVMLFCCDCCHYQTGSYAW